MKKCLLFAVAMIVLYAIFSSCKAQATKDTTIEIGRVLWTTQAGKVTDIFEVWKNQCPPPAANIFVHDTLWEIPGGYSINRPAVPPVPFRDTLYQLLDGTFTKVKPAPLPISIFTTQTPPTLNQNDGKGLTVGVKFRTSTAGFIRGVRFYKVAGNTAQHTGELYNAAGTKLATGVYSSESASGWQTLIFTTPVPIALNTVYVATVFNPVGYYAGTLNGFATSIQNQSLTGLADGVSGVNGVYDYGAAPVFPKTSFSKTNYWVDAIFTTTK